jgi:hypothetical protein
MDATYEWQEYDHDYEKDFHDIRLKDGTELKECWPNAGIWYQALTGREVSDEEVTHVRLTDEADIG